MNQTLLLIIVAFILGIVLTAAFSRRKKSSEIDLLVSQMNELSRRLDERLAENTRQVYESLTRHGSESGKVIREVANELGRLSEIAKQQFSSLEGLKDIFKNPKQRGVLGEFYLETLLANVLPPKSYKIQYTFKDGSTVDAVVFLKDKIIPIDSKFSLENYNRLRETEQPEERERLEKEFKNDLKKRIDETAKYIKPEEGTMEFAFMFIPHEAIYYDLLVNEVGAMKTNTSDLIDYAFKKRVIAVSPTSFHAYLQTVLQGLKALQIEETAKDIIKKVNDLGRHLSSYEEYMKAMGKALGQTVGQYNKAAQEFKKIDKDILKISGQAPGLEPELLPKPTEE